MAVSDPPGSGSNASAISWVALPTDGPVVIVPEGVTVSSPDCDIVDNQWLGTPVAGIPLPEPTGGAMLGAGIGLLGVLARRRSGRCAARSRADT